jgi:DNA-binding NarL/FixJ family response regulator
MSTVLIVDDHASIRQSVRSLLRRYSTIDICGEAKDGKEAIEKVGELRPDIVLLDITMPRMNGIQAAQEIHRILPSTKILFFTIHPLSLYDEGAAWSQGFVSKLAAETHLIPALNHLLQTNSEGLNSPLRYQWQHSVMDAFASAPDSLLSKIDSAEHAIAARFTDLNAPDRDEQIALNEASRALRQLISKTELHHTPEAKKTARTQSALPSS